MVPLNILFGVTILVGGVHINASPNLEKFMQEAEVRECLASSSVSLDELGKHFSPASEMSTEKLCFFKCLGHKYEMISDDGDVIIDESKPIPFPMHFPEDKQKEFLECASNVGKIEKCEDMSKFVECIPKPPNH